MNNLSPHTTTDQPQQPITDKQKQYLLLLRTLLAGAALAWGCSALGLVLPWSYVSRQLVELGAQFPEDDTMIQYWLKMAAAVYSLGGIFWIVVALRPRKYHTIIAPLGILHLALAAILLATGLHLNVHPIPLYIDTAFCVTEGAGLLIAHQKLKPYLKTNP